MKSRVKELKRVKASELRENPANWRVHPETQRAALKGLLAEIGFAGALLARKDAKGNLILIDGHLRKEIADDEKVPVLITDLNEAEADLLLAAYDPIASMALADESKLQDLLARIHSEDEGVKELLGKLKDDISTPIPEDWKAGAAGIPSGDKSEFIQMTFTLHETQAETVKEAIDKSKKEEYKSDVNENSNGNALEIICAYYNGKS